ncbi:MAG: cohesin domain-containing protein [Burkholderiaceae bacterium]|nr:cohesin domain-containing protein [Burkholderiaceae bacterium]
MITTLRNRAQQQIKTALSACLLAAGILSAPAMATTISFSPSAANVGIGGNVAVDVRVSGLGAGTDLGAFDLNVLFDASLLNLTGYALGASLGDTSLFEALDISLGNTAAGKFNLSEISLLSDLSAQQDAFTLATLYFSGAAVGSSALSLGDVLLGDAFGNALPADLQGASVTSVPEPHNLALFLAGLALAGAVRRQRKQ